MTTIVTSYELSILSFLSVWMVSHIINVRLSNSTQIIKSSSNCWIIQNCDMYSIKTLCKMIIFNVDLLQLPLQNFFCLTTWVRLGLSGLTIWLMPYLVVGNRATLCMSCYMRLLVRSPRKTTKRSYVRRTSKCECHLRISSCHLHRCKSYAMLSKYWQ